MRIKIIEYGQNLVKLLYFNSFVAIKILLHYDCFNKNSRCLQTTLFTGNFDSICVLLHRYELFRPVHVVSSWLRVDSVATDSFGWLVADGFGWLRMVSDGLGWFWVVCCFSSYGCAIGCSLIYKFSGKNLFLKSSHN